MKVIIIEDEVLMADALEEEILSVDNTIEIEKKIGSVKDALSHLSKNELPDLFFSDIQLSDGLSFEIFSQIESTVPVIFCTAYDEYALEAFKANGIDYLLKPFDSEAIRNTLRKYNGLTRNINFSSELKNLLESFEKRKEPKKNSLLVHRGNKIFAVKNFDIRLAYLQNGITSILTKDNKRHIVNYTVDMLDNMLGEDFYRVNRQIIIHQDAIQHVSQYFARKLIIESKVPFSEKIIVSKANATSFLRWLESK